MWVKILLLRPDLFTITIKKRKKVFMEQRLKDLKELKEEGIEASTIPWIEDKKH